ncbi:type 4a pilus biogenesis protein PilO [Marinibactrum halimedae]|uniref:Type 4 fimbrial biogenesis protein PilO n=1 Tax=Marinibactrum halimedae TaxID=1444977 RepID=A0AA37WKS2_9GAMM|nr:type 4a pilus biogenesis protein PilO [Marinibactrum halimedae]MCD9459743.1 type 4a pilus biogenesis protein PilO [Marinibactrum halimedae]GLS24500.1 type 4 fimbrial biogenesis protein PilO [Marinibactrum halimedae]
MSLADAVEQLQNFDINDLDFERIGTWPILAKVVIWILAFALILTAAYFLKVKELNETLEREVRTEQQLRDKFKKRAFEAANLQAYRDQMREMEEAFGAMLSQLPKDSEVPGLLEDITERGSTAGLAIKSIQLETEVVREFYVELPISISVEGGYHQLGTFVSGVSGLPRIVTLHNYSIQSSSKGAGPLLQMSIQAKTYRYKPQEQ